MSFPVILPEMGEGVIEGTLTRWLVSQGDRVEEFDPIAEVETDKVTTEILSDVTGIVLELCVNEGETVPVETVVAHIGQIGEEIGPGTPLVGGDSSKGWVVLEPSENPATDYNGRISPVVSRIAAEHQVNLNMVTGTGRNGRITKRDILAYVEELDSPTAADAPESRTLAAVEPLPEMSGLEQQPQAEPNRSQGGKLALALGDQLLPLDNMRRSIAQHMVQSKHTSPHATTVFEFDFSAVSAHRQAHKEAFLRDGAKLTFTVYIVSAVVQALKGHQMANSVWTDEGIVLKREINIGLAVAIPGGLIVPVIMNADGFNLLGLARAINDLVERARMRRLKPDEIQGGTFSITNHGTSGSLFATPIINQPQAGILGIGKIEKRVRVINDAIAIRPLSYASFTFDHRILDGASADAFVSEVKERIEHWR